MSRLAEKLIPALTILAAAWLAAGCGQSGAVKNAVSSAAASKSVNISPPTFSRTRQAPTPGGSAAAPAPAPNSQSPAAPSESPESAPASPAASGAGSSLVWLWIVLGAIAVLIVAVLIARRSGRRSATAAGWHSRMVDAYAEGSALYDAMSHAQAPAGSAAEETSARWADIQRRTGDLTQTLYALRETAPGEAERARVEDVLASLQAVRSVMDAERAASGTAPLQGARVHNLLLSFEASLRALRSSSEHTL